MGLSSLSTALSGLRVNQQQVDVISNNIANVGTPGYTRKILPQVTQAVDGQSIGVLGETIIRNVDLRLQADLWTQVSAVGFYDVQSNYLARVDQFHGAPDANVSVAAEVSKLHDAFGALANAPDDQFLLSSVVDQAQDTAKKINDLSDFYTTLRNNAQNEAEVIITSINDLLEQIQELNSQIRFSKPAGTSTAATEDARDNAIIELTSLIDISTFSRGDGVLVVQTAEGVELASDIFAADITFNPTPLSAQNGYPETAAAIFVGDPVENPNAINITEANLGAQLGGLMTLRDQTFPKQLAQIDELAHKLALRFDAQGLRLFTDQSGTIPLDTPPDPTTDPVTTVDYVGFASLIQVNDLVVSDNSLLQRGTYGGSLQSGANDIIRRVIEFTFGDVSYQSATNPDDATAIDIRAAATGGTNLRNWLGLNATNSIRSGVSLSNYNSVADIVTAGGDPVFGTAPTETDQFIIRFSDPDFGGTHDIEIDLSAVPAGGVSAAQDLVDFINADPDFVTAMADFNAVARVGINGELVIESSGNIEIVNSPIDPINDQGFAFLGLGISQSVAEDPYFDVGVGNNGLTRISILPNDTEVELLAKLNAVPDLVAEIDGNGFLSLRPGETATNPNFGGDLRIIGGPTTVSGAGLAGTALGRTSVDDGVNIAQALFGTYSVSGGVISETSPLVDVRYQSETQAGSGDFVSFRSQNLGASAGIDSDISQSLSLKDFSQKIINEVAQELALIDARLSDEQTLEGLLTQQLTDQSGVNIDEELGYLIVVQTAYSASARVITAVGELFDELINII